MLKKCSECEQKVPFWRKSTQSILWDPVQIYQATAIEILLTDTN